MPIICCENTSVGKMATDWRIGKTVNIDNKNVFESDFDRIDVNWLRNCSENCFKICSGAYDPPSQTTGFLLHKVA